MAELNLFNDDPAQAVTEAIADYEAIAGRTLGNADPERLVISAFALRLAAHRTQCNVAVNQNTVRNATGAALEELAAKFGIYRLDAAQAKVVMSFVITGAPGTVLIPAGTRVKSNDGKVLFAVDEDTTHGNGIVAINCTCTTAGIVGNGYAANNIQNIADPIPYVTSATNSTTSIGGSDVESDDQLRARVPLANATFSTAGPSDGYIYWAKTASADIVDVAVKTEPAGTVNVYPLLNGGVTPGSPVLDAVLAVLSDKKVRPMNDTVVVSAPTAVTYGLIANIKVKRTAVSTAATLAAVQANLQAYVDSKKNKLGADVMATQVINVAMSADGMYDVQLPGWSDVLVDENEYAVCTGVTVNIAEVVDEV